MYVGVSALAVLAAFVAVLPVLRLGAAPLAKQPFPDSQTYVDGAWQLARGHGYVTNVEQSPTPVPRHLATPVAPRYPFGTSAVLVPFVLAFGRIEGAQTGARVIVALYVLAVIAAAWLLGGPLAALLAALFVRGSPFADTTATLVLSDPLAALLAVLILVALIRQSTLRIVVARALAGALIDVRLLGIVALPAAFLAAGRRRWILLCAAVPGVALLAYYQWTTFGSPFVSGYSHWLPHLHQFGLGYLTGSPVASDGTLIHPHASHVLSSVCACDPTTELGNLAFYPAVLSGVVWIYTPPLIGLIGLIALIRARRTPPARYALALIALNVVIVYVYFWQAARLVAPAASLLLVYAAVGLASFAMWAIQHGPGARRLRVATTWRRTAGRPREGSAR